MGKNPNIFQDNAHQVTYDSQGEIIKETFRYPHGDGDHGAYGKEIIYSEGQEVTTYFDANNDVLRQEVVEFNENTGDFELTSETIEHGDGKTEIFHYESGELTEHFSFSLNAPDNFEGDADSFGGSLTQYDIDSGDVTGTDIISLSEDGKTIVEHYDGDGQLTSVDHLVGEYDVDREQDVSMTERYQDGELIQTDFFNPETHEVMSFDKDGMQILDDSDTAKGYYDKDKGEIFVRFESDTADSPQKNFFVYDTDGSHVATETRTFTNDGMSVERIYTDSEAPCGTSIDYYDSEGNLYCTERYDVITDDGNSYDRVVEHYIDGDTKEVEYQTSIGDDAYETVATETLPIDNTELNPDAIDSDVVEGQPIDSDNGDIDSTDKLEGTVENADDNMEDIEKFEKLDASDDDELPDDKDFDDDFSVDFGDWEDDWGDD